VEDVVAQHQGHGRARDEFAADEERLRETFRLRLLGVVQLQAQRGAVAQQRAEPRQVFGGADDQDFADARQHQDGQRVIDHGFVVHRQQLFADDPRDGIEPGPRTARQNDAFHPPLPFAGKPAPEWNKPGQSSSRFGRTENWKPGRFSRKTGNTQDNRKGKSGLSHRARLPFRDRFTRAARAWGSGNLPRHQHAARARGSWISRGGLRAGRELRRAR